MTEPFAALNVLAARKAWTRAILARELSAGRQQGYFKGEPIDVATKPVARDPRTTDAEHGAAGTRAGSEAVKTLVAIAVAFVACKAEPIDLDPIAQDIAKLENSPPDDWNHVADQVSDRCCRDGSEAACVAVRKALRIGAFASVSGLLRGVDARCTAIDSAEAIAVLRHHWPNDLQSRIQAFRVLREREVSPEVMQVYLEELADPHIRYSLTLLGDEELAQVAARVDDPNPAVRETVYYTLSRALVVPVQATVLRALEHVAANPDPWVAGSVSRHLREYKYARRDYEQIVAHLLAYSAEHHPWDPEDPIILLSVRHIFCDSAAATKALDDFAKSTDPLVAAIAVQSIAVRAKRCHR